VHDLNAGFGTNYPLKFLWLNVCLNREAGDPVFARMRPEEADPAWMSDEADEEKRTIQIVARQNPKDLADHFNGRTDCDLGIQFVPAEGQPERPDMRLRTDENQVRIAQATPRKTRRKTDGWAQAAGSPTCRPMGNQPINRLSELVESTV
jgi:hypothetical protein